MLSHTFVRGCLVTAAIIVIAPIQSSPCLFIC